MISSEGIFDVAGKNRELALLDSELSSEVVWKDASKMATLNKKSKLIKTSLVAWNQLGEDFSYLQDLTELEDEQLYLEVAELLKKILKNYQDIELRNILSGAHDTQDVLLTINAGAGGTDAQDWASMLLRMYTRYAEKMNFNVEMLDISEGDEAGLKSVTLSIAGDYAYGLLKAEHGIHRLVRLSPFNANNKRQTSFASVDAIPQIEQNCDISIRPEDIRVDTFRSSGAGGQHINKTDSAVRITHIETNIVVQCQNQRSQIQNREVAMRMLISKLAVLKEKQQKESLSNIAQANKEISWGNQIRSYVFHPYTMVKDHRTNYEEGNVDSVMDGYLSGFIDAYLHFREESVT